VEDYLDSESTKYYKLRQYCQMENTSDSVQHPGRIKRDSSIHEQQLYPVFVMKTLRKMNQSGNGSHVPVISTLMIYGLHFEAVAAERTELLPLCI